MVQVHSGGPAEQLPEAVLFPFDSHAFPFSAGMRLQLVPGKTPQKRNPIVLRRGGPGSPDELVVRYYGTVVQVGDELRMWYLGRGHLNPRTGPYYRVGLPGRMRVLYAVSRDGVQWEKPDLQLVDYGDATPNNVVDFLGGEVPVAALTIIHDPDDADDERRFKAVFESTIHKNRLAVAYSADGLRWTASPGNPVGPGLEQTGLVKFGGCYYANGQGGTHFGQGRKLVTFASYDFEHWTQSSCLGFRRDNLPPRPVAAEWNSGEEVHLGAGLWNRGNVIVGIYGMWHGHPSSDRNKIGIDLGLVVSNDALDYREPIPDFRFIPAYEEWDANISIGPALSQGQGMCNVGDQTLYWYGLWRQEEIRLASWERDRLGYFEAYRVDAVAGGGPHSISCPIRIGVSGAQLFANVGGLSERSAATVELLDERFHPLPGYSGDACVPLHRPGLRQPVVWKEHDAVRDIDRPVRVLIRYGGVRPEDARLYALYVSDVGSSVPANSSGGPR